MTDRAQDTNRVVTDENGNCPVCHHPVVCIGADCDDDKCPCRCSQHMLPDEQLPDSLKATFDAVEELRSGRGLSVQECNRIADEIVNHRLERRQLEDDVAALKAENERLRNVISVFLTCADERPDVVESAKTGDFGLALKQLRDAALLQEAQRG